MALSAFPVGSFVNGLLSAGNLNGWSVLGSASAVGTNGNIVPTVGSYQAMIGSGEDGEEGFAAAAVRHGLAAASVKRNSGRIRISASAGSARRIDFAGVPVASLATLGLTPEAISSAFPNLEEPTYGSVMYQTFAVAEPTTLSFDWNFATNENIPTGWDGAAYSIQKGSDTPLLVHLADTHEEGAFQDAGTNPFEAMTGYKHATVPLTSAGTYTVAFLSIQTGDNDVASATYISNVVVDGAAPAVPLPGTWTLALTGMILIALSALYRKFAQSR